MDIQTNTCVYTNTFMTTQCVYVYDVYVYDIYIGIRWVYSNIQKGDQKRVMLIKKGGMQANRYMGHERTYEAIFSSSFSAAIFFSFSVVIR